MFARPLMPAVSSRGSPSISPKTFTVWLTGSTRPLDRVMRALKVLLMHLESIAELQPGEPAREQRLNPTFARSAILLKIESSD
jgi:hypothetical protein